MMIEGLQLMIFGMGMVFIFLLFLVLLTFLMSKFLLKGQLELDHSEFQTVSANKALKADEEVVAVISSAVRAYQKNQNQE